MFGKSKSQIKNADLAAAKVINGSLSANREIEFYQTIELKVLEVLAKEHCFDIDRLLAAPELSRMIGFLENMEPSNYPDLANGNSILLHTAKISLIERLNRCLDKIDPINQGVNLYVLLGKTD
ncbi:TPA: hypothetical protein ACMDS1_003568 [Vibrio parahaemolyticus]